MRRTAKSPKMPNGASPKMKKSAYPKKSTTSGAKFGQGRNPAPPTGLASQRVAPMKRARTVD